MVSEENPVKRSSIRRFDEDSVLDRRPFLRTMVDEDDDTFVPPKKTVVSNGAQSSVEVPVVQEKTTSEPQKPALFKHNYSMDEDGNYVPRHREEVIPKTRIELMEVEARNKRLKRRGFIGLGAFAAIAGTILGYAALKPKPVVYDATNISVPSFSELKSNLGIPSLPSDLERLVQSSAPKELNEVKTKDNFSGFEQLKRMFWSEPMQSEFVWDVPQGLELERQVEAPITTHVRVENLGDERTKAMQQVRGIISIDPKNGEDLGSVVLAKLKETGPVYDAKSLLWGTDENGENLIGYIIRTNPDLARTNGRLIEGNHYDIDIGAALSARGRADLLEKKLPEYREFVFKEGDTLSEIANRYKREFRLTQSVGSIAETLRVLHGIEDARRIPVGFKLVVDPDADGFADLLMSSEGISSTSRGLTEKLASSGNDAYRNTLREAGRRYASGETSTSIAQDYVNELSNAYTVARIGREFLQENGLTRNARFDLNDFADLNLGKEFYLAHQAGMNYTAIAKDFEETRGQRISRQTVAKYAKAYCPC